MIKRFVYLNTGIMESIYHSQVEPVLRYFKEKSGQILHISLESGKNNSAEFISRLACIEGMVDSEIFVQRRNISLRNARLDAEKIENIIASRMPGDQITLIHARGHVNAFKSILIRDKMPHKFRVHADLRGVLWDEVKRGNLVRRLTAPYRSRLYLNWEKRILKNADSVSCVSDAFKDYLEKEYKRSDISVIPTFVKNDIFCFSPEKRKQYREKLEITNEPVMIYCGGVSYWQKIDETIELYKRMLLEIPALTLLFVTHSPEVVKNRIGNSMEHGKVRIIKSPHDEVPFYMSAADVAVMLRDDIPTNNYAAPTKFGEYLCCGLPVILSPGIGDTERIINKTGFGYILHNMKGTVGKSIFEKLSGVNRNEIASYAKSKFSKDVYLEQLMDIYLNNLESKRATTFI